MQALWITRPEDNRWPARGMGHGMGFSLAAILGFGLILGGIFGCGHEPRETSDNESVITDQMAAESERPLLASLPAPRSEWIDYSAKDRKLTLYHLRASGRWMVKRSDRAQSYPIGAEHVLPEGINPNETIIYYTRPGGQISRGVTLAQIQSATREHVSIAR